MILGGQFQMQGRLLQLAKSQSLHLDKRQGLWPAKKPEDIRQHALSAASMLRYTHWYTKVSETNKQNNSCTISRWDLLWKCWDCVYGGTEEMKAVSRSHPPHTHTRHHHLEEDVEKTELCLSWNSCETCWGWGEIRQNPHPSFLPIFQQRIGSQVIIVGDLGLASDNFVKHKEVI